MNYVFAKSDNTVARRSDNADVAWNPQANQPMDIGGSAGRQWIADGSPIPAAYVAPPPTADQIRAQTFLSDTDRQNIVTQFATATPAQIKTFISNNFPSLTAAERLTLAKIVLLMALTIRN